MPEGIEGLFPGMFVKVSLVTGEKQVLMVPVQSAVYRSEVTAIYVIAEDGTVNFRHVRLGSKGKTFLAVLSGLVEGEQVALDPIQAGIVAMQQRSKQAAGSSSEGSADE